MARNERFVIRVNKQERQMIERLAQKLERSQSDAVRLLVKGAAAELGVTQAEPVPAGEATNERS